MNYLCPEKEEEPKTSDRFLHKREMKCEVGSITNHSSNRTGKKYRVHYEIGLTATAEPAFPGGFYSSELGTLQSLKTFPKSYRLRAGLLQDYLFLPTAAM